MTPSKTFKDIHLKILHGEKVLKNELYTSHLYSTEYRNFIKERREKQERFSRETNKFWGYYRRTGQFVGD